jgi:hypothetical protein
MQLIEVSKLARDKGCALRVRAEGGASIYWIENPHFIGKPYANLNDLITFLQSFPGMRP